MSCSMPGEAGTAAVNCSPSHAAVDCVVPSPAASDGLDPPPQIVISADARTPHQSVITVMDAARQAGLFRLTFAARRATEPES